MLGQQGAKLGPQLVIFDQVFSATHLSKMFDIPDLGACLESVHVVLVDYCWTLFHFLVALVVALVVDPGPLGWQAPFQDGDGAQGPFRLPGAEGDFFATGAGCCKGCELAHGFGCCVFFSSDDLLILVGRTSKGNKKRLLLDFILLEKVSLFFGWRGGGR